MTIDYYLRHPKMDNPNILNKCSQADLDNLNKFTLDTLIGVLYEDDVQEVSVIICQKSYDADSIQGIVVIKIEKTTANTKCVVSKKN